MRIPKAGIKTFRDLGKISGSALATCFGGGRVIGEEAPATPVADGGAASCSQALIPRKQRLELLRSQCGSEVEYETKKSTEHSTEMPRESFDDHVLLSANSERFKQLMEQWHCPKSEYGFFLDYGERLIIGSKIAEGGQAEIFDANFKDDNRNFVLKVFKSSPLEELERLWPAPLLPLLYVDYEPDWMQKEKHCCWVRGGTVLKDGRFAFLMDKYEGDLRSYIDRVVCAREDYSDVGPFELREAVRIMLDIARGMRCLHERGILHRDLKASNVLLHPHKSHCVITDFETSLGVFGTGFWRAPEVLHAMKNRNFQPDLWTKKADVYSYAMTCYEVITGHIPFENLRQNDYDIVLCGGRPSVPDWFGPELDLWGLDGSEILCDPNPSVSGREKRRYPVPWLKELLERCWDHDPSKRPSFHEIVKTLSVRISLIPRLQPDIDKPDVKLEFSDDDWP